MEDLKQEFLEVKEYVDSNLPGLTTEEYYMDVVKGITKYYASKLFLSPEMDKTAALRSAVTSYFADKDRELEKELDLEEERLNYRSRKNKSNYDAGYYADELIDNEDETIADIQGRHL